MPSTMIIMPAMKRMVLQLMPVFISLWGPCPTYQKVFSAMLSRLKAVQTAPGLCITARKTIRTVQPPATRVTMYRGNRSRTISTNMMTKMITAMTWAKSMADPLLNTLVS